VRKEKNNIDSIPFSKITQALSVGFEYIYYVDTETGSFVEFGNDGKEEDLEIQKSGEDFFSYVQQDIRDNIYSEDQQRVSLSMAKDTLLSQLIGNQSFSMTFRRMEGDVPVYYNMKAVRAKTHDDHHIVISISNIDEPMRKELENARMLANKDSLTGVKNKRAFTDSEKAINAGISSGDPMKFAVVFCDVNGLKTINDSLGHNAGDEFLRNACHIICNIFKHSPVFRIGGDEFAAILQGSDYENRKALIKELEEIDRQHIETGGIVIACGMAEYDPENDTSFQDVFNKADAEMYKHKKFLKGEE